MIDPSKPVRLRRAPEYVGKVEGAVLNDRAYVRWQAGGSYAVHVDDLIQDGTDTADKSWPPKNLETKVPGVDRK